VCFSPQADVVGGIAIVAIGADAALHLRRRRDHLLLATLPLLLGFHQLVESLIWWQLQGDVPHLIGRICLWIYMLIAFVVLPTFVPIAVLALETTRRLRWRMVPFVLLGAVVSVVLLVALLRGPVTVELRPYHLAYGTRLHAGWMIVTAYVVAICGSLLFSGYRHIVVFGLANLLAVGILARLTVDGFASLWCGYAAVSAGATALHMRYAKPHRATPYVLT
jgi:hypothetical protein